MSFSALYEYMHGEFQDVTRVPLAAAGVDPAWVIDPNGVKIAGHQIELWDAETGGTQLLEGVDYSLVFLDSGKTAAEGVDIWAGYQVINVAYQGIPLYITARIIGGYTKHNGGIIEEYELDGQMVVKWDTGLMTISARVNKGPIAVTIASESQYRSGDLTIDFVETFSVDPIIELSPLLTDYVAHTAVPRIVSESLCTFEYYSLSSTTITVIVYILAIGRWK